VIIDVKPSDRLALVQFWGMGIIAYSTARVEDPTVPAMAIGVEAGTGEEAG